MATLSFVFFFPRQLWTKVFESNDVQRRLLVTRPSKNVALPPGRREQENRNVSAYVCRSRKRKTSQLTRTFFPASLYIHDNGRRKRLRFALCRRPELYTGGSFVATATVSSATERPPSSLFGHPVVIHRDKRPRRARWRGSSQRYWHACYNSVTLTFAGCLSRRRFCASA